MHIFKLCHFPFRFILTAAHCLCNRMTKYCTSSDDKGEKKSKQEESPIDIIAVLGIIYLDKGMKFSRHSKEVIQTMIHHEFVFPADNSVGFKGPDLALLEIDKPLPDDLNSAQACLPASSLFPDRPSNGLVEKTGVIIGMGNIYDVQQVCFFSFDSLMDFIKESFLDFLSSTDLFSLSLHYVVNMQ